MSVLSSIEPKKVFEFFELISSVPHGSGNTKQISDICAGFARERGLEYRQDSVNNVIIYKKATKGYENEPTVVLQGHMDMVCAKYPDDPIDMSKEPIKLCTDGEWVWAHRTSLGGDDCIAVALAMAILDDDTLEHPALEAVFTVDEETDMGGAEAINPDDIHGRLMVNLDSEEEGVFTVGCAGGTHISCDFPLTRTGRREGTDVCSLVISGLLGGHSGCEIEKERGNAILLAGRILNELAKISDIRLISLDAGSFANVIPSKSVAVFEIPKADRAAAEAKLAAIYTELKAEYAVSDPGICVELTGAEGGFAPADSDSTRRFLKMLVCLPNGVRNMSPYFKGLVQTSLSIGVIKTGENSIVFPDFVRSSLASQRDYTADQVINTVEAFGGTAKSEGSFPGWAYNPDSELREKMRQCYVELNGKEPVIFATHGGLEVGLFMDKLPGMDVVSMGPEMRDIHSVHEKINVASVQRLYALLVEFLKKH